MGRGSRAGAHSHDTGRRRSRSGSPLGAGARNVVLGLLHGAGLLDPAAATRARWRGVRLPPATHLVSSPRVGAGRWLSVPYPAHGCRPGGPTPACPRVSEVLPRTRTFLVRSQPLSRSARSMLARKWAISSSLMGRMWGRSTDARPLDIAMAGRWGASSDRCLLAGGAKRQCATCRVRSVGRPSGPTRSEPRPAGPRITTSTLRLDQEVWMPGRHARSESLLHRARSLPAWQTRLQGPCLIQGPGQLGLKGEDVGRGTW